MLLIYKLLKCTQRWFWKAKPSNLAIWHEQQQRKLWPIWKILLEKCWVASARCENALGPTHDMTNYTGQFTFNYPLRCSPQWRSTGNGTLFYIIFNKYFIKEVSFFSSLCHFHYVLDESFAMIWMVNTKTPTDIVNRINSRNNRINSRINFPKGIIKIFLILILILILKEILLNLFDGDKLWTLRVELPDGGMLYVSSESQLALFVEKSSFIQQCLATMTEIKRMMLWG